MTTSTKPFVPDVELTAGQPAPIAANGGKAYTSLDVNGDAGTAAAVSDALEQSPAVRARRSPILSKMQLRALSKPHGARVSTLCRMPRTLNPATCRRRKAALLCHCITQSLTPLPTLWCRLTQSGRTRSERRKRPNSRRTNATTRAAASTFHRSCATPGASQSTTRVCRQTLPNAWTNWGSPLASCESQCQNFYDSEEVRSVFYAEMEQLLLEFFRMPATLWSSITTSLIKITRVTAQKTKTPKTRESMPTTPTWCTTI